MNSNVSHLNLSFRVIPRSFTARIVRHCAERTLVAIKDPKAFASEFVSSRSRVARKSRTAKDSSERLRRRWSTQMPIVGANFFVMPAACAWRKR